MPDPMDTSQNYAVLFSGGGGLNNNHFRYYNSLKGLYEVLEGQYSLPSENIYILYGDGGGSGFDAIAGEDEVVGLLKASGDYQKLEDVFNQAQKFLDKKKLSAPGLERLRELQSEINYSFEKLGVYWDLQVDELPKDPGKYLVKYRFFRDSDMSFATGSSVLPGNSADLQNVLGTLSDRVDDNDHVFVWTFDHGGFGTDSDLVNIKNEPYDPSRDRDGIVWGNKSSGNKSNLTTWDGSDVENSQLAQWIAPVIQNSGYTTLAYAQCFSGGMLDASRASLSAAEHAYGMAATNGYELSYNYDFAEGIRLALQGSDNPIARDVFDVAKASDKSAAPYPYADNGGFRKRGIEHPWAYGGSNGNFSVFSVGDALHPLERQGIDFQDSSEFAAEASLEQIDVSLAEDSSVDLLASLVDQFGRDVTVDAVTWPGYGSLEVVDGALLYTPMADFHGSDSFLLRYSTQSGTTEIRYSLNVSSVNDAPVASDTFVAVDSGKKRVKFSVDSQPGFLGDFDLDGDALRVTNFSAPEHGRLKKIGKNNFRYKPNSGFEGRDSFLYQITDGEAYSVAEVTLTVGGDAFSRDPFGFYELKADGPDPIVNPLRAPDGSLLNDDSSSRWDIVAAEKDGSRYNLLLEGEGKKDGLYKVWTADESGQVVRQRKRWLSPDQLEQKVYGTSFGDVTGNNAIGSFDNPITEADINWTI